MKKIKKLTPEQEAAIPTYIAKWVGMASGNTDIPAALHAVRRIYKCMGESPPVVLHFTSPLLAAFAAVIVMHSSGSQLYSQLDSQLGSQLDSQLYSQLGRQLRSQLDSQLDSQLYSQLGRQLRSQLDSQLRSQLDSINRDWYLSVWWLIWCGWYDYARYIGVQFDEQKYTDIMDYCSNVIFAIPYKGICFISHKPTAVHWRGQNLHRDGGMAVEFADGWGCYALNGVSVPAWVVNTPASEIDVTSVLKEPNAEVRREIVRKVGVERLIQKLQCKSLDKWQDYELLEMPAIEGMSTRPRYLKMKNPSIGVWHVEGVPPHIKTCKEALSWRIGGLEWKPEQLT